MNDNKKFGSPDDVKVPVRTWVTKAVADDLKKGAAALGLDFNQYVRMLLGQQAEKLRNQKAG